MFVALMPLHILLGDEVLPYNVLCVEVLRSLSLNLNCRRFEFIRSRSQGYHPPNLANLSWVEG
jgi:hypothetical protein